MTTVDQVNEHAKALGKLGAAKGGRARASVLSADERTEIARKAVKTRWAKKKGLGVIEGDSASEEQVSSGVDQVVQQAQAFPVSLYQGILELADVQLPCHVLDNFKRVIAQREVVNALTGVRKGGLDRYLRASQLVDYIDSNLVQSKIISFSVPGFTKRATGYEGTLLIDICDAYLRARDAGVLTTQQLPLAKRAEIIIRATAKLGIEAVIDEVTGFQEVRQKNALQLKLQAFISDELQEWARMFPEEFWIQLARLENTRYSAHSRPLRWGKYVMAFVYDAVDKDVGQELRKLNPNPHYKNNNHQWLKEFGRERVKNHLYQVLGIMKTCTDMADFNRKFGYVFKKNPLQLTFFDLMDMAN